MELNQLKILAYDKIVELQKVQAELMAINNEIAKQEAQAKLSNSQ